MSISENSNGSNLPPGYISRKERSELFRQIGAHIDAADSIWIFCHENPDGDTLGCSLACLIALRTMGKDVHVFTPQPIARMYAGLPGADDIEVVDTLPEGLPQVILSNDNASFERFGREFAPQLKRRGVGPDAGADKADCVLINIDHHIGNERYGDINLVDPSCGACGEVFFHMFKELGIPIDRGMAVNIYATILTDTGRFAYSNTTYETFQIASELIQIGADPYDVVDRVYNTRTTSQLKLISVILQTVREEPELDYFYCSVTQGMLKSTGTLMSDTEGVADILKTVADYDVCFLLKEEDDGNVKASVRSNGKLNVNLFARRFGGGGHPAASGFRVYAPIDQAPALIAAEMRDFLKVSATESKVGEPVAE